MSTVAIFWMCRACKEDRPDVWISVAKRRIVVDVMGPGPARVAGWETIASQGHNFTMRAGVTTVDLTACYCNDRPRCFLAMPAILDAMARSIIDGLIAPRVHIFLHGLAICDPHKRWPDDFPKGTKWIDLTQVESNFIAEVSCESCRAHYAKKTSSSP